MAEANALAAMVDWNTFPEGMGQTVKYEESHSGLIQTSPPSAIQQPGSLPFIPFPPDSGGLMAGIQVQFDWMTSGHRVLNSADVPSWAVLNQSSSPFGNIPVALIAASATHGRANFPGPWCRRVVPFTPIGQSNTGPSRCNVGTLLRGTHAQFNELNGGRIIMTPGDGTDGSFKTFVVCSTC
jgi:hypothetical protein